MSVPRPPGTSFFAGYHAPAIATIAIWALAFPLTRVALRHFTPESLAAVRFVIASAAMLAIARIAGTRLPDRRDWPLFILGGASGFALYMLFFCKGSETLDSASSSVIIATTPITTNLLARIFLGERLSPVKWAAVGVEFSGILVLVLMNADFTANAGVLYVVASTLCSSVFTLLQRVAVRKYSAIDATCYSILAGSAILAVFLPGAAEEVRTAAAGHLLCVALLGAVCSSVAFVLWTLALRRAESTASVTAYIFVTPFFAALLGFAIAGETPDASTVAGGGIIMLGLLLFIFGERPPRAAGGRPS